MYNSGRENLFLTSYVTNRLITHQTSCRICNSCLVFCHDEIYLLFLLLNIKRLFQGCLACFIPFISQWTQCCTCMVAGASSLLHNGMVQQIQPATSKADTFFHKLCILILILFLINICFTSCCFIVLVSFPHIIRSLKK